MGNDIFLFENSRAIASPHVLTCKTSLPLPPLANLRNDGTGSLYHHLTVDGTQIYLPRKYVGHQKDTIT